MVRSERTCKGNTLFVCVLFIVHDHRELPIVVHVMQTKAYALSIVKNTRVWFDARISFSNSKYFTKPPWPTFMCSTPPIHASMHRELLLYASVEIAHITTLSYTCLSSHTGRSYTIRTHTHIDEHERCIQAVNVLNLIIIIIHHVLSSCRS